MIERDVLGEHEYERVPFLALCGEYPVTVITCGQVGTHLRHRLVLAYLHYGLVLPDDAVQDLPVDARIVVIRIDEFRHVVYLLYLFKRRIAALSIMTGFSMFPAFLSMALFLPPRSPVRPRDTEG